MAHMVQISVKVFGRERFQVRIISVELEWDRVPRFASTQPGSNLRTVLFVHFLFLLFDSRCDVGVHKTVVVAAVLFGTVGIQVVAQVGEWEGVSYG